MKLSGSKFGFIVWGWAIYVMAMSSMNVANIIESRPLLSLGLVVEPLFIFFMFLFTILLEIFVIWFEKKLDGGI